MLRNFKLIILFFTANKDSHAYDWPVDDFSTQHPISGTIGEFRPPVRSLGNHFHDGIDIAEPNNTEVFPIISGSVKHPAGLSQSVIVANFTYKHVINRPPVNTYVTAYQDIIGLITSGHLHLMEDDGANNPLLSISPFDDNKGPTIHETKFYEDAYTYSSSTTELDKTELYGKVDIVTKADDTRLDENGDDDGNAVAPYSIGYTIMEDDGTVITEETFLEFTECPSNSNIIYTFGSGSSKTEFYWILTNAPFETSDVDRYWNTKLKEGEA